MRTVNRKGLIQLKEDPVRDLRDSSPECPEQSLRFFGSASE
jgi:hypothetical protein